MKTDAEIRHQGVRAPMHALGADATRGTTAKDLGLKDPDGRHSH